MFKKCSLVVKKYLQWKSLSKNDGNDKVYVVSIELFWQNHASWEDSDCYEKYKTSILYKWQQRDSNPQPLGLQTNTQPFSQTGNFISDAYAAAPCALPDYSCKVKLRYKCFSKISSPNNRCLHSVYSLAVYQCWISFSKCSAKCLLLLCLPLMHLHYRLWEWHWKAFDSC